MYDYSFQEYAVYLTEGFSVSANAAIAIVSVTDFLGECRKLLYMSHLRLTAHCKICRYIRAWTLSQRH
jgi:hypothetical protein